ncbi:MAG: hypothetical protein Q4F88_06480 [Eubacteriales bacterium]|nr:hypothetical protein [Eubacteriales bacterium]
MMNEFIIMTRQELYDEIWEISLTGVAKKYNLNYSKLSNICKENDISYPTSAYWTKKNMGLDITKDIVPLTEPTTKQIKLYLNGFKTVSERMLDNRKDKNVDILSNKENMLYNNLNMLNFLSEDACNSIVKVIDKLNIDKHKKLHKIICDYKNKLQEERREERKRNYYNPYYNVHEQVETGYFCNISKLTKQRCMKILSCIYYAIEELGGKINNDFSMQIRNELVTIELEELKDQVNHELTKEEARKLLEYEEERRKSKYAYKPNIRKYDYIYNGKLKITFESRNYIKDTDNIKLENRLADIIIRLYEKSEQIKNTRLAREEREKKEREEERKREEIRNRKKEEAEKIKALVNIAEDFRVACNIRNYIEGLKSKNNINEETKKWIEWAGKKADWFDPTIDLEDELLGKRNHEESKENKEQKLDKYTSYYGWY